MIYFQRQLGKHTAGNCCIGKGCKILRKRNNNEGQNRGIVQQKEQKLGPVHYAGGI